LPATALEEGKNITICSQEREDQTTTKRRKGRKNVLQKKEWYGRPNLKKTVSPDQRNGKRGAIKKK